MCANYTTRCLAAPRQRLLSSCDTLLFPLLSATEDSPYQPHQVESEGGAGVLSLIQRSRWSWYSTLTFSSANTSHSTDSSTGCTRGNSNTGRNCAWPLSEPKLVYHCEDVGGDEGCW